MANSSGDPISNKPNTKRAGGMAQGVGLSSNPSVKKNPLNLVTFGLECFSGPRTVFFPKYQKVFCLFVFVFVLKF
jgi:hypothetical protein